MPVSLSEILNIRPNPEVATGTPAVVLDSTKLVDTLNRNAQFKAQMDWQKYTSFLNNYKDVVKDLAEVAKMDVATEDREKLQKDAGDIFNSIANDPRSFFQGGESMREVYSQLSQLQARATESKLNKTFDTAHRMYLERNPELNTPENQAKIQSYLQQPLGSRQSYTLDMPTLFDSSAYGKAIMESPVVQRKTAESSIVDENKQPGTKFIREVQKVKYDRNAFMQAWMNGLNTQQDKYGHSIRGAVEQRFKQLPPELQKQYKTPENLFRAMGEAAFGSDQDIEQIIKDDLQNNPNAYRDEQLAIQREQVKQGWANIGLQRDKLSKDDDEDILGADSVINEALSIIDNGIKSPRTVENYDAKGGKKTFYTIDDPTLLQSFGNIDKDGKTINIPDEVQYDKDADRLNLIYFKKNPLNGQLVLTPGTGKRQIQDSKGLDSRTWLKLITKRSFPNKNIGTINTLVDKVLKAGGDNLFKLNEKMKEVKPAEPTKSNTPPPSKHKARMPDGSIITSPDGKTWYDNNGKKIQ